MDAVAELTAACLTGEDSRQYRHWRNRKLARWSNDIGRLFVTIRNPARLGDQEKERLLQNCMRAGLSFYRMPHAIDKTGLKQFWQQLNMRSPVFNPCSDDQGISAIRVEPNAKYIPYTEKPLGWHTDGYYNTDENAIRAFAMHCISPATEGGTNAYFNPDILYILLRDENPNYIAALSHPKAMTIPANFAADQTLRPAAAVPVFTLEKGNALMRYTERSRNIIWRDDKTLTDALDFIRDMLAQDTPYRLTCKLKANEGVICNNVLHKRTAFRDSPDTTARLLYRARFNTRVPETFE